MKRMKQEGAKRLSGERLTPDGAKHRAAQLLCCLVAAAIGLSSCADTKQREANTNTQSAPSTTVSMNSNMNGTAGRVHDERLAPTTDRSNAERYEGAEENSFLETARAPLSTFSIDVDTASYSNARRFIREGSLPPADAIRIEEFINYFTYNYPQPVGDAPFSVTTEASGCPWNPRHRLVHIGLQGRQMQSENLPPANLVFLVDVSGSMQDENKLPLLKRALNMLAGQLTARDRLSIVVYAGTSGLALPPTAGDRKGEIRAAINALEAGGSTNGGEGIGLAYRVAGENFIRGGTNRVILATDGDFNVGIADQNELVRLIEEKRRGGVFLSVLGFGTGNLNDATMEQLADKGDGNYAYIDSFEEARKVLGQEIGGTLATIAKDVKIQVEFNPRRVAAYRLIGYENRLLRDRDFNDDAKDAGEIGAGRAVTALYEVVPYGERVNAPSVTPLKYDQPAAPRPPQSGSDELMTVQLRYKEPSADESKLLTVGAANAGGDFDQASENLRFAAAVASFGMLLKDSKYKGDASFESVLRQGREARGADLQGHRAEFLALVEKSQSLARRSARVR